MYSGTRSHENAAWAAGSSRSWPLARSRRSPERRVERVGVALTKKTQIVIVGGPGIGAYRPIFEGNNKMRIFAEENAAHFEYSPDFRGLHLVDPGQ